MRRRPSSRLLILDPEGRLLLFRFVLPDRTFWATPGGGVEAGETFEQAARRELAEETGLQVASIGTEIARREFVLRMPDGEEMLADERFFLVPAGSQAISHAGWTTLETRVMAEHRWWTRSELQATTETIFPTDIPQLLVTWHRTRRNPGRADCSNFEVSSPAATPAGVIPTKPSLAMEQTFHPFSELFVQLGLPEDEASIQAFIETHSPMAADVRLADAPFWTPSQAALLREQFLADAEWAEQVDQLNLALHRAD